MNATLETSSKVRFHSQSYVVTLCALVVCPNPGEIRSIQFTLSNQVQLLADSALKPARSHALLSI